MATATATTTSKQGGSMSLLSLLSACDCGDEGCGDDDDYGRGGSNTTIKSTTVAVTMAAAVKVIDDYKDFIVIISDV